jgi:iduronate 2-sulfatase
MSSASSNFDAPACDTTAGMRLAAGCWRSWLHVLMILSVIMTNNRDSLVVGTGPTEWLSGAFGADRSADGKSKGLLFIVIDDMRPELSIYGKNWAHTPNFERLANRSTTFDLAFAQVSVCNPSRDSMLTGLRPDTVGVHNFQASFRPHSPFFSDLKKAGFATAGIGKVFNWDGEDGEIWSTYSSYNNPGFGPGQRDTTIKPIDQADAVFGDYQATSAAIAKLKSLSVNGKPYAIGLGLQSTHAMSPIPKKYFDLTKNYRRTHPWPAYNAKEMTFPKSAPIQSYHCCVSLGFVPLNRSMMALQPHATQLIIERLPNPFPEGVYEEIMWGFLASVAFVDAQLGRILNAVDELKLWDSLTIIVTSDHGTHMGEKGIW